MNIPGYDNWKLAGPPELTAAEERFEEEKAQEQEQDLREALAAVFHDNRGDIYLADFRRIVVEELNKVRPFTHEPEWQTKTPVPIPGDG